MPDDVTLLRGVRTPARGLFRDVLVAGGVITAMTPRGRLERPAGATVVDAGGRYLLPGLWDEHTHMSQWALSRSRVDLSGAESAAAAVAAVIGAMRRGPIVGYGFRDAQWRDQPTLRALDTAFGSQPVILVSADLHCAWLNTAGAGLLGVEAGEDGMVREGAWFPAMARLDHLTSAGAEESLRRAADDLPARGVVGVVDLEWADNIADWSRRLAGGNGAIRVDAGIYPDRLDAAIADGVRTGQVIEGTGGLLRAGPVKILSDGSLNTRTAYCRHQYRGLDRGIDQHPMGAAGGYGHLEYEPDMMLSVVRRAHRAGIRATIHAIGDLAVTLALDVFEQAGAPGRIEHAQLIAPGDEHRFARLGVEASVQPEHALDDRDLVDRYWPDRSERCFPLALLHSAGAVLRLGSDAPVATLDPWVGISAAVTRTRDGREPWHSEQALDVETALAASSRGRTDLRVGDAADLILLDNDPTAVHPGSLAAMPVSATMVAGRWTHGPA